MSEANTIERRLYERFALDAKFTQVTVQRVIDYRIETLEGHAYDVSESLTVSVRYSAKPRTGLYFVDKIVAFVMVLLDVLPESVA